MVSNPFLFLGYDFGVRALVASILSGFVCSAVGSYVVLRKMSFAGAGLSHVAFSGVAFGFLIGLSPILTALLFTLSAAAVVWYLSRKGLHFDVGMGVLFATSMALAVLFLSLSNAYGASVLSYLFGSPLSVETQDLLILLVLTVLISLFFTFLWREIYLITFSEEIAKASGYRVELITFLMNLLIATVVTFSLKAVGALLVFSLLVVPSASAFRLSKSYGQYFTLSLLFGVLSGFLGMLTSFALDAPSGATITLVSFLIFLLSAVKS